MSGKKKINLEYDDQEEFLTIGPFDRIRLDPESSGDDVLYGKDDLEDETTTWYNSEGHVRMITEIPFSDDYNQRKLEPWDKVTLRVKY